MYNTEILALHIDTDIKLEEHEGYCKICGKKIKKGTKYKNVLSGNFTNYDELKGLDSEYVCKECAICMKTPELRKNNFIADTKNLYLLKKNDLENYLFDLENYVNGPFVIGITESYKKHNSFRCKVNTNPKKFYIRHEDKEYLFDAEKLKPVYDLLNEAYMQFSKEELLTGNYKIIGIQQFGLEKFNKYEKVFRQHRGTAQFQLLVYILNSERRQEEIKRRGKTK